jgi:hypothetical protein
LSSQMILEARHRVTNRQLMSSAGSGWRSRRCGELYFFFCCGVALDCPVG